MYIILWTSYVRLMIKDKIYLKTKSFFFLRMLVTYGPLSHESIEADEATEESRLLHSNCYFLGVLKGVERTLYRRGKIEVDILPKSLARSRCCYDEKVLLF